MRVGKFSFTLCLFGCLGFSSFALENFVSEPEEKDVSPALLEVFQVYPQALSVDELDGSLACPYTLMEHTFAHSAGKPYTGTFYQETRD